MIKKGNDFLFIGKIFADWKLRFSGSRDPGKSRVVLVNFMAPQKSLQGVAQIEKLITYPTNSKKKKRKRKIFSPTQTRVFHLF
jgi:hypothetical protein